MRILITGCAGFIGANFTKYWLNNYTEDTVIGIDCLTYAANISVLKEIKDCDKFNFYKANICDRQAMERIFQSETPDIVVNFAAESHVDRSIEKPRIFLETNILGVQTLLDVCLQYGIKRFHQVSTDEVYGELPLDNNDLFTENSPLKPSSPYSASKAAADMLVLSYFRTYGLSVSISRSTNNYGKYQHTEKLIPKVIEYALSNKLFPIYGDGLNVRDWIYVDDHCRAIDMIVRNAPWGSVYNVGGGTLFPNVTLIKEILKRLGKSEDLITFVTDRKGHDKKYALNCNKIHSELGWKPQRGFFEGLKETIEWYRDFF
ncbi:MAG: dTDP-glucose 4,6-dehydratase [Clostridiales bacterium]|nr:dTDP-glucose 4,6-dehydratase [Clostridiales bacterium]MBE5747622.1 dTDP-glucose 4,6-dehydratase [Clostridiales bacterium]